MTASSLIKGQNVELPDDVTRLDVLVTWVAGELDMDGSALLLDSNGRVRDDGDFVFYNQSESKDASVRHLGGTTTEEGRQELISIELGAVAAEVQTIVISGSSSSGPLGDFGKLGLHVQDSTGSLLAEFVTADASSEQAFVFGELYRRGSGWKLRAVGQGWDSGLEGLATNYGVHVDDSDAIPVADNSVAVLQVAETSHQVATVDATVVEIPSPVKGVKTRKKVSKKAILPEFVLSGGDSWQTARLFSISGVGSGEEQEKRATSALLATMQAVKPFARAICGKVGAPVGPFEGYLEVSHPKGEGRVIPDAVLRVSRAGNVWTCLVEVKTGSGKLQKEQLENYLDVARRHKYEVVLSISNDIPAAVGDLPVLVDKRKLAKVALRHISWSEVIHEARMLLSHGGIDDPLQAWVLNEFLRYLTHPRSGATEFVDMGRHWVPVRDAVASGTVRPGDAKADAVADKWTALSRNLALRFTADLGVTVKHHLPRRLANDADARRQNVVEQLAAKGSLTAVLRIPDCAGDVTVEADLRTNKVHCSTSISAPETGTSLKRVQWLLKQLADSPPELLVEAQFAGGSETACENLTTVRADPKSLYADRHGDITAFTLTMISPLGSRRSGTASSFITSVTSGAEQFYSTVVQGLKPWTPSPPVLVPQDESLAP